jgi:hypothetical protein
MVIDQRNAGAIVTTSNYSLDRWQFILSTAGKVTAQQSSTAPTGFNYSTVLTSTSAYSVTSTDNFTFRQAIEGFNFADLGFGTASAKTVTISFWVQSSLTGTFGANLRNYAATRSYPFNYTISSANTWQQVSITIAGDTSGTWNGANNGGTAVVEFSLGAGSNYLGTANTWASAYYIQPTGSTNLVANNGATLYITGVQLEVGSNATGYEYVNYQTSLANCQRYCQTAPYMYGDAYSTTGATFMKALPVTMRADPTSALSISTLNLMGVGAVSSLSGFGSATLNSTYIRFSVSYSALGSAGVGAEAFCTGTISAEL